MLDNKEYYGNLFEFYKDLLTANQIEVCTQYFFYDYSLFEIAEEVKISKQAVKDTLDKAVANLEKFEAVLHLSSRYDKFKALKANKTNMDYKAYIQALENLMEE